MGTLHRLTLVLSKLRERSPTWVQELIGPALILGSVLLVLHDYALGGQASSQRGDPIGFFLPMHCFLGESLVGGDVPLWNPHTLGGHPFASDPQSGWLNLPAMLLYSLFPCDTAFAWYVTLQPLVAGTAIYWFLRTEGLGRPEATIGGLALALPLAGSSIATASLPFSASIAWTAVVLGFAARLRRARTWRGRSLWLLGLGVAWGQLASAHMSTGLALGTLALLAYLVAAVRSDVRSGERAPPQALALVALVLLALPFISAGIIVPRLLHIGESTLGLGYSGLEELSIRLTDGWHGGVSGPSLTTAWPLELGTAPGYYLGPALLLIPAAWLSRRYRSLAIVFSLFGLATLVLALGPVADVLDPMRRYLITGIYLHAPERLVHGLLLALPILVAVGSSSWSEANPLRLRVALIAPAIVIWVLIPPFVETGSPFLVAGLVASLLAVPLLLLRGWSQRRLWALTILLMVVLSAGGVVARESPARPTISEPFSIGPPSGLPRRGLPRGVPHDGFVPQPANFGVGDYVDPGPIAQHLAQNGGERYISVNPERWFPSGYIAEQPGWWGLMSSQQSMLFDLEEAQGYNPAQGIRFWTFVRTVDPKPIQYNRAWFLTPTAGLFDLLQVGWVVAPNEEAVPAAHSHLVAEQGVWKLFRVEGTPPRASVVTDWTLVGSAQQALERVVDPTFDSSDTAVLEEPPGIPEQPEGEGGWATFSWTGSDSAQIDVYAQSPSLVLIRNVWHPNWTATVDGTEAPVLPTDYLVQSVPVLAGRHTIRLEYRDPWIWIGLIVSGGACSLLVGTAAILSIRARRRRRHDVG